MSNPINVSDIKAFFEQCSAVFNKIKNIQTTQVTNKAILKQVEDICCLWFKTYSKELKQIVNENKTIDKYDSTFECLLKLSGKNNRTTSYITQINNLQNFRNDIVIPLQTGNFSHKTNADIDILLKKIIDEKENEYLYEAMQCFKSGYQKAAIVLGWCATIDRIHRVIENIGFDIFNNTSLKMKNQTSGRFKRFNKDHNVQNISDLRAVFDSDILLIIEGMELIDFNQGTRLKSCFDMRCHSGHPGNAPITYYNILSFFSDIIEIVLANPTFLINTKEI